jgi:threonine/homoserine/homoserine lactone efflux protein
MVCWPRSGCLQLPGGGRSCWSSCATRAAHICCGWERPRRSVVSHDSATSPPGRGKGGRPTVLSVTCLAQTVPGSSSEGYIANTLNPPIAAFYFLILPQFVSPGDAAVRSTLILTIIHVSMAATWHVAWAIAGGALAARLSAGRPRASLEIATGVALSALALAILL